MATSEPTTHTKILQTTEPSLWWRRWRRWLLRRVWLVHPGFSLIVTIPPALCLQVLGKTARPDMGRLEFRHLFADGRRYHLGATANGGFSVMTTHKVFWHSRRRTSPIAIVFGEFEVLDNRQTRIMLRGRIQLLYLLTTFLLPIFFTSMIIYMPWHPIIIVLLGGLLFGLSWASHRYNAALEVYHMMNYIQKVFSEFESPTPTPLAAGGGHVVYDRERDFAEAWQRYYQDLRNET